jgi:phosphoesterase RecJ-like protein
MTEKFEASLARAAEFIQQHDDYLLVTHERPDGDAIGSIFGLLNFLHENGKRAEAVLPETLPEKYLSFVSSNYRTNITKFELAAYQSCLVLDTPNPARGAIGGGLKLEAGPPLILLDHHPDNQLYGMINVVAPNVAATAELLFMMSKKMPGWKVSPRTATLWLMGIVTDTGGFRFDNTSPQTLRHAAELLERKADHHTVMLEIFFSKSLELQQFESELVTHHLHTDCGGRFAWIYIPEELIRKYRIDMRDTEGLIEILRSIKNADIVALLQRSDDGYKMSLRSKDPRFSVGKIARQLNGGGHELAAGGRVRNINFNSAIEILTGLVRQTLNQNA